MDICLISGLYPPEVIGGAERHVKTIAERLISKGHSVSVITSRHSSRKNYTEYERTSINNVDVFRFTPLNLYSRIEYQESATWKKPIVHTIDLWNPHCYLMIRRILSKLDPDIVHVHTFKGLSNAAFAAAEKNQQPILHTLHDYALLHVRGDLFKDGSIIEPGKFLSPYQLFNRNTIEPYVDRILAPSQFIIAKHHSEGLLRDVPCTWLPLGVEHKESDNPLGKRTQSTSDQFRVLYTGQLHARKGVDLLIKAFSELKDDSLRLDILGKGPDRIALEQLASNDDRIRFHGFVSESQLEQFYAQADLAVVPSRWYDNSPLVIYESYSQGTPVLGANIGGIPELIDQGNTGYLFEPDNIHSLKDSLLKAYNTGTEKMAQQAYQKSKQLTLEKHINELIKIYNQEKPNER